MIIMDVKLDNFYSFHNFHMNMSYPKRIVDSYIQDEFLEGFENFRYKKINILMGANASGKTTFGKMLMHIFNFIDKKQYSAITNTIDNKREKASFSIDLVGRMQKMYRLETIISPMKGDDYSSSDISVQVKEVLIKKKDSYETCVKKIENIEQDICLNYIEELEKIEDLAWLFRYPADAGHQKLKFPDSNQKRFQYILENILKALDPSIKEVEKLKGVKDSYVIRINDKEVIIQNEEKLQSDVLSSGTKAGIDVACMVASILNGDNSFYYCDEKFSYIHSDIEKAVLSLIIDKINPNEQFFFTTHNTDILELPLPKHSFVFMKKDVNSQDANIQCISASSLLKRNTDSLKKAVENDLFSTAPATNLIFEL